MTWVSFKPDNPNIVVSSSYDKTIKTWDITSGSCLSTLRGHSAGVNCVDFSPDGLTIASGSGEFVSGSGVVRVWDVKTGKQLWQLRGHSARVNCVDFSPDGLTIASGSGDPYGNDNSVRVWDVKTGKQLWQLSCDSPVWSIDWHENRIVAGCHDGTIKVFNAQSGDRLSTVNVGYAFSRCSTRISLARPLFSRFSTRISV